MMLTEFEAKNSTFDK